MSIQIAIRRTLILFCLSAVPLIAHHAVGHQYDESKATTIQGSITKLEWVNPHIWISLDVKNANGTITSWRVEAASPNTYSRAGIRPENFELTKAVSIEVWPARDGSKTANGRKLTNADGRTYDISDKFELRLPTAPVRVK